MKINNIIFSNLLLYGKNKKFILFNNKISQSKSKSISFIILLQSGLNFTFNKAQQRTVNVALSNTFGFGGHNACVIVKKYNA